MMELEGSITVEALLPDGTTWRSMRILLPGVADPLDGPRKHMTEAARKLMESAKAEGVQLRDPAILFTHHPKAEASKQTARPRGTTPAA